LVVLQAYWDFDRGLSLVRPHQFLAIQRGETEKALTVSFSVAPHAQERFVNYLLERHPMLRGGDPKSAGPVAWKSTWWEPLTAALTDGLTRLLKPSIQREWRRQLKEAAEDESFDTYRKNLRSKLMIPPIVCWKPHAYESRGGKPAGEAQGSAAASGGGSCQPKKNQGATVIGIDPGFRTGCKIAVVDPTGQLLEFATLYPNPPQNEKAADKALAALLTKYRQPDRPLYMSIGNGTASRETEEWASRALLSHAKGVGGGDGGRAPVMGYVITDEAGASVYSASILAGAELPSLDVTIRGAVSIARRLQDPLAEYVKIDPQSLGVGLYQHDLNNKRLSAELRGVVESCVNNVGVDANTASPSLLEHIAGLNTRLSKALVQHRNDHGVFQERADILKVKGLGPKSFEQAAGFLRVYGGSNALDATAIHPESYETAARLQRKPKAEIDALRDASEARLRQLAAELNSSSSSKKESVLGWETLRDVLEDLPRDGGLVSCGRQDPRVILPRPMLKVAAAGRIAVAEEPGASSQLGIDAQQEGLTVDKLKVGTLLRGTVRNVVAFGAFIDIGVQHDGLLHVSQYPPPKERPFDPWPRLNDRLGLKVLSVDRGGGRVRIGLGLAPKP